MSEKLMNNEAALPNVCTALSTHLSTRYFLVGHQVSIADFALVEACQSNQNWESQLQANPAIARWAAYVCSQQAWADAQHEVSEVLAKLDKDKASSKGGSYEIDLPGAAMGKVVTRFPPEPSGYLHIGHMKACLLNDYFAKYYKGKLILRFDDTNPNAEKEEFVEGIYNDLKLAEVVYHQVTHTSDSFDVILDYATKLIKKGGAYVDDTPQLEMQAERKAKQESPCRNQSIEENLRRWDEMQKATEFGLKCVLRAKIDMTSDNATLRDPALFRCNVTTPHHRTGTKYKVYPTYDFACPIVDSLEGVTHALRTVEYRDRNAQYDWVLQALGLRKVHIWDFSKLSLKYTVLSKRKLKQLVEMNAVTGWDDPRFPTVRGIVRRGLSIAALREFIKLQGASQSTCLMEWDKLWAMNRDIIEKTSKRYSVVSRDDSVLLQLKDINKPYFKTVDLHPKDQTLGTKEVAISGSLLIEAEDAKNIKAGEEITLINLGNAIVEKVGKDKLEGKSHLDGNVKATKLKTQWVSKDKTLVNVNLIEYDHLIKVEKLEPGMELSDPNVGTECSKYETAALGEAALANVKKGEVVQLTRRGFYICDKPLSKESSMDLIFIPDGKQKGMSTLSSKVVRRR
eukprot:gb/GEZN01002945.1/.p1 GENE.gb/GEZN01002945.1/~~gb/GEZN01002945.1/.p1  ORF type:complete len:728 (+),score=143.95 gb/GEZN01002945.1/:310-2184(+)